MEYRKKTYVMLFAKLEFRIRNKDSEFLLSLIIPVLLV
jgi:hypothetical protein